MRSPTMKRQLKVMAITVAIGPLAYWGPGLLETVSGLEIFAVRKVEVTGIKILTENQVLERLALGSFASEIGRAHV